MDSRRKPPRTFLRNSYKLAVRVIRHVAVEGERADTFSQAGFNGMRAIERGREAERQEADDES